VAEAHRAGSKLKRHPTVFQRDLLLAGDDPVAFLLQVRISSISNKQKGERCSVQLHAMILGRGRS